MSGRAGDEIEKAFRKVERVLDELFRAASAELSALPVEIRDESNRSGFDWAGPYFVWRHAFDHTERGWLIQRVLVTIEYLEPWDEEPDPLVKVGRRVEIFQLGKPSEFRDDHHEKLSLERLMATGMHAVVARTLEDGLQVLEAQKRQEAL